MFWLIAYFSIGLIWSIVVTISLMDVIDNVREIVICAICNFMGWPLIILLALVVNKIFKGLG
jgi:hypothetical protein